MRNRILSIALALSLLAVVFVALPTKAYVDYTGSVKTTDDTGTLKDTYVQGQQIYVSCEVRYQGQLSDQDIRVRLESLTGGTVSQFTAVADVPEIGWYNSTETGAQTLATGGAYIPGDRAAFYVVLYERWSMTEIDRTTVTILKVGLSIEPAPSLMGVYYPGQSLTAKLVTTYVTDMFYVHTVNETGVTMSGMNWTAQIAPTGYWEHSFTLAADFPDGMYTMKVRDSTTDALRYDLDFYVQKYIFEASADRYYYLPGETAKIDILVVDVATLAEETGVVVTYNAHWWNYSANGSTVFESWENGTLLGTFGYDEFLIPTDVAMYEYVEITYWANESAGRSASAYVTLNFETLDGSVSVDSSYYMPGDTVVVSVHSSIGWDDMPNATVDISVVYNGTEIAAYSATDLSTDEYGDLTHTFTLVDTAGVGTYIVSVTISKVGFSIVREAMFQVEWSGWIETSLDKQYYYGGDAALVTFQPIWNGQEVTVTNIAYFWQTSMGLQVMGNTSSNSATFDIPAGYYGYVEVYAYAPYSEAMLFGYDSAEVHFADIALVADKDPYRPGETINFGWQVLTGATTTGNLAYEIIDDNGVKVAGEAVAYATSGSFSFVVPTENPSTSYEAEMWMTTLTGGYAEASLTVDIMPDNELMIWVEGSSYNSGAFKPGATVTVHYSVGSYLHDPLPSYMLYVWTSYNPVQMSLLVSSPTGTFDVMVPEDAPTASMWIYADLYDGTNGDYLSYDQTAVTVSNELSGWDKNIGGMSAINFTLLILIVIMILLLIIVPFLKGRMGGPKAAPPAEAPPPAAPPQPPSP